MTERHGFTGGQLMLALAGGALLGAAVALLLTPKTGRELRSRVKELALETKERAARMPKTFGEATEVERDTFTGVLDR